MPLRISAMAAWYMRWLRFFCGRGMAAAAARRGEARPLQVGAKWSTWHGRGSTGHLDSTSLAGQQPACARWYARRSALLAILQTHWMEHRPLQTSRPTQTHHVCVQTPIRTCPDFCVSDLVPACLCGRCTTNAEGCTAKGMWSWVATCISCCTLFQ